MNRVEGDWKEFKGKVQQQWGKLTNDDLDVIEANGQNSPGAFSSAMVWRSTRPSGISMLGSTAPPDAGNPVVRWSREALLPQMNLPRGYQAGGSRSVRGPILDGADFLRLIALQ